MRRSSRLRSWRPRPTGRLGRAVLLVALFAVFRLRFGAREEAPLTVAEIRALLPEAARLEPDAGPRAGVQVFDEFGQAIGYAVRTMPAARDAIGYAGPTDALVVFDQQGAILGMRVRSSADTDNHVADVQYDDAFKALLDGLTWEQAAAFDLHASAVDAVSGATLTSRAMIEGVVQRLRARPIPWRWGLRDTIAAIAIVGGLLLAYRRVRPRVRLFFAAATIAALGFAGGDFVTVALLPGWAATGPPLETAPGLVLLCVVALVIPWTTGKAVYCQQICAHGLLQDLVARLSPWRGRVRPDARRALRWAPRAVLIVALAWAWLEAPVDIAQLEAFDAYLLTAGAGLSIAWAVVSLLAALVSPRAYCRYACATGALLEVARVTEPRRGTGPAEALPPPPGFAPASSPAPPLPPRPEPDARCPDPS